MTIEIFIENRRDFERGLDRLGRTTDDFRIPFRLISADFYRSQRQIFNLKSEGQYAPLGGLNFNAPSGRGNLTKRELAENEKERITGHAWAPILYGKSGDLRDSTLSPTHQYSVFFLGRKELEIGTSVPYGRYLQEGTENMAARPFIFIDSAQTRQAGGRRERWLNIINDHVLQLLTGRIF